MWFFNQIRNERRASLVSPSDSMRNASSKGGLRRRQAWRELMTDGWTWLDDLYLPLRKGLGR
jgi:hypothetical protein